MKDDVVIEGTRDYYGIADRTLARLYYLYWKLEGTIDY